MNVKGRVLLIDLAFAHGDDYHTTTRPFIRELGDRLAAWIDHHPHPAWVHYSGDPRFILVDKRQAPACPELITPARHIWCSGACLGAIALGAGLIRRRL